MAKIVYVLGAGFSVPFGLPTLRDFLPQARKIALSNAELREGLDLLDNLAPMAARIQFNVQNIEDCLSVVQAQVEMGMRKAEELRTLQVFVAKVIKLKEMAVLRPNQRGSLASTSLDNLLRWYASMHDVRGSMPGIQGLSKPNEYAILNFNYDSMVRMLPCLIGPDREMVISAQPMTASQLASMSIYPEWAVPHLHLHGSALSTDEIVLPTWSKSLKGHSKDVWRRAAEHIRRAFEIRFVGFSMATADSYFKHFLGASLVDNNELHRIVIIDPSCGNNGGIEDRYRSVFGNMDKEFYRIGTEDVLSAFSRVNPNRTNPDEHEECVKSVVGKGT